MASYLCCAGNTNNVSRNGPIDYRNIFLDRVKLLDKDVDHVKFPIGADVYIVTEDLVQHYADGIICSEGHQLDGSGPLAKAIAKAGGDEYLKNRKTKLNKYRTNVRSCRSGKQMLCTYVFHAIVPVVDDKNVPESTELLRRVYNDIIKEAKRKKLGSIAIPLLGAGNSGFHVDVCAEILVQQLISLSNSEPWLPSEIYITNNKSHITDIIVQEFAKQIAIGKRRSRSLTNSGHRESGEDQSSTSKANSQENADMGCDPNAYFRHGTGRQISTDKSPVTDASNHGIQEETSRHSPFMVHDNKERAAVTQTIVHADINAPGNSSQYKNSPINGSQYENLPSSGSQYENAPVNPPVNGSQHENPPVNGSQHENPPVNGSQHDNPPVNCSQNDKSSRIVQQNSSRPMNGLHECNPTEKEPDYESDFQLAKKLQEEEDRASRSNNVLRVSSSRKHPSSTNSSSHSSNSSTVNQKDRNNPTDDFSNVKHVTKTEKMSAIERGASENVASSKKDHNASDVVPSSDTASNDKDNAAGPSCPICLNKVQTPKNLPCGHCFCEECLKKWPKPVCAVCAKPYGDGVITGNQPLGKMDIKVDPDLSLAGFEGQGLIIIHYDIPNGVQQENHPSPGTQYSGLSRIAYLPNTSEGQKVLHLLKVAFDRKLVFTIGHSHTKNCDNVVTWNDIHHKTSMSGGPERFGFPDPTYLARVLEELKDKGITE